MSTLHVENLKGLSSGGNANKIIVPSGQTLVPSVGQVVNYKSYTDTTMQVISASTFTTVYTFPTYTPVLTNSTIIYKICVQTRTYRNGGSDSRGKLRFIVDGTTVIDDQSYGPYDYGGSGTWFSYQYSGGSSHSNTDGSTVSASVQLANLGNEVEYNSNDDTSTKLSFYEIMEIVQ